MSSFKETFSKIVDVTKDKVNEVKTDLAVEDLKNKAEALKDKTEEKVHKILDKAEEKAEDLKEMAESKIEELKKK